MFLGIESVPVIVSPGNHVQGMSVCENEGASGMCDRRLGLWLSIFHKPDKKKKGLLWSSCRR